MSPNVAEYLSLAERLLDMSAEKSTAAAIVELSLQVVRAFKALSQAEVAELGLHIEERRRVCLSDTVQ